MEVLDVPTPRYSSYNTKKYVAKDGSKQSCFQPRRACGITIRLGSRTCRVSSTSSFLYQDRLHPLSFPSVVGRLPASGFYAQRDTYCGAEALQKQNHMRFRVTFPIKRHETCWNYDGTEQLLYHSLNDLSTSQYEDVKCPVLLAEASCGVSDRHRERITQMMMETFDVPLLLCLPESVLSLVGTSFKHNALLLQHCLVGARGGGGGGESTKTGDSKEMTDAETMKRHNHLTTGLVIDVGATKTSVVPVVDGLVVHEAVVEVPVGGEDVDHFVLKWLQNKSRCPWEEADDPALMLPLCRTLRREGAMCCATEEEADRVLGGGAGSGTNDPTTMDAIQITLDDGGGATVVTLEPNIRCLMSEVLFRPCVATGGGGGGASGGARGGTQSMFARPRITFTDQGTYVPHRSGIPLPFDTNRTVPEVSGKTDDGASNASNVSNASRSNPSCKVPGISGMIQLALDRCPSNKIRQQVVRNVVLVGGCTKVPGFEQRIQHEVNKASRKYHLMTAHPSTLCFVQCFRTDRREQWNNMNDRKTAELHLLRYKVGLLRQQVLLRILMFAGMPSNVQSGGQDASSFGGTVIMHVSLLHHSSLKSNKDFDMYSRDNESFAPTPSLPFGLDKHYCFLSNQAYNEFGPILSHVAFARSSNRHRQYDRWKDKQGVCYYYHRESGVSSFEAPPDDVLPKKAWMPVTTPFLFPLCEGDAFLEVGDQKYNDDARLPVALQIMAQLKYDYWALKDGGGHE